MLIGGLTTLNKITGGLTNNAAFLPTQLSGLVFWVRADSITGVANGSPVSSWKDQSGTGDANKNLTQTGSNRPTFNTADSSYNGQPSLSFVSASSQYLLSGTWASALAAPYTIVAVGNYDGTVLLQAFCGSQTNNVQMRNGNGTTGPTIYSGALLDAPNALTSNPVVVVGEYGASGGIWQSAKTAVVTGSTGTSNIPDFSIGQIFGGNYFLNGKVAECVVYNRALSSSEVAQVLAYAGQRYNIAIGS